MCNGAADLCDKSFAVSPVKPGKKPLHWQLVISSAKRKNYCKRSGCDSLQIQNSSRPGSKAVIEHAEPLGCRLCPLWHVVRIACRRLGQQEARKAALDPTEQATDSERWHPIRAWSWDKTCLASHRQQGTRPLRRPRIGGIFDKPRVRAVSISGDKPVGSYLIEPSCMLVAQRPYFLFL